MLLLLDQRDVPAEIHLILVLEDKFVKKEKFVDIQDMDMASVFLHVQCFQKSLTGNASVKMWILQEKYVTETLSVIMVLVLLHANHIQDSQIVPAYVQHHHQQFQVQQHHQQFQFQHQQPH